MKLLLVTLAALGTALATGLGVLPLMVFRRMTPTWVSVSNALAGGFMGGAAVGLFYEGVARSAERTAIGAVLGALFVFGSRKLLGDEHELHAGELRGADAHRALVVVGVMTLHSFTEGVGVGVSFAGDRAFGILVAVAIAVHNIPEGLAISLAMVPNGSSIRSAAGWSIFSSLPQPLMAIPAYIGVSVFKPLLPAGLGFAGGAMILMVGAYMIPDALRGTSGTVVAAAVMGGAAAMLGIGLLLSF